MKIAIAVLAALASGGFMAVPIGLGINNGVSPLWGMFLALLMIIGVVAGCALFFAPDAPFRWLP